MAKQSNTPIHKHEDSQMYLVDLSGAVKNAESQQDILDTTAGIWSGIYSKMESDETLWIVAPNTYQDGRMWPIAMEVANYIKQVSEFVLKNTITVHQWEDRGADMESAYDEILFFVKDKREYRFNKDNIRVSHVYQGNEWGGEREEGNSAYHDTEVRRYNPDGKDPGNVWLHEDRTQTGNQEIDETGPISLDEALRRCVLAGSNKGETVHTLWSEGAEEVVTAEERTTEQLDPDTLREEAKIHG